MGPIKLPDAHQPRAPRPKKELGSSPSPRQDMTDLRLRCLDLALQGSSMNLGADFVIERAQNFVTYVLDGPAPAPPPTLENRLTQAFLDAGESLTDS